MIKYFNAKNTHTHFYYVGCSIDNKRMKNLYLYIHVQILFSQWKEQQKLTISCNAWLISMIRYIYIHILFLHFYWNSRKTSTKCMDRVYCTRCENARTYTYYIFHRLNRLSIAGVGGEHLIFFMETVFHEPGLWWWKLRHSWWYPSW